MKSTQGNWRTRGFTLVELLVVITIIGVLVALLLPAVQAAREAVRRNSCKNNLKQLALGWMNHESTTGHFPTDGWGFYWVGDADLGFGKEQPGGWMYNVLPFIEQQPLHDLSSDGDPNIITDQQRDGTLQILLQPVATFSCPSRLSGLTFTNALWPKVANNARQFTEASRLVGRGDYAANMGDQGITDASGPTSLAVGLSGTASWPYGILGQSSSPTTPDVKLTGVSFQRSKVALRNISDGTSNTYMIGERFTELDFYETGTHNGDNETWCTGFNNDNFRNAFYPPLADGPGSVTPSTNGSMTDDAMRFGSAHPGVWLVAYCDGSVHSQSYDIDSRDPDARNDFPTLTDLPSVHQNLANRDDGRVVVLP